MKCCATWARRPTPSGPWADIGAYATAWTINGWGRTRLGRQLLG